MMPMAILFHVVVTDIANKTTPPPNQPSIEYTACIPFQTSAQRLLLLQQAKCSGAGFAEAVFVLN